MLVVSVNCFFVCVQGWIELHVLKCVCFLDQFSFVSSALVLLCLKQIFMGASETHCLAV